MTHEDFIIVMSNLARERTKWTPEQIANQVHAWWPRFSHIDAVICRDEFTVEQTAQYVNISNVHARCRAAQDEKNAQKPRPRPEVPDREVGRIGARAVLLMSRNRGMTFDEAKVLAEKVVRDDHAT